MMYYVDAADKGHEIFIPPGRWNEANDLLEHEKWDDLAKFPPWSDQPPLPPREADRMSYTDGRTGAQKAIHLPQGTLKRAAELYMNEDWAELEREFKDWSKCSTPLICRRLPILM
jgi:hypothetical protein